jgi:HK97 family phage major capsid protein
VWEVQKEIRNLLDEADTLARKVRPTDADKLQHSTILARVAALRRSGDPQAHAHDYQIEDNRKRVIKAWRMVAQGIPIEEIRANQEVGQTTIGYSNESGSAFVPTQFLFSDLSYALAEVDPVFSPDVCTRLTSEKGGLLQCPVVSDVSVLAKQIPEAAKDKNYDNVAFLGQIPNRTFLFRGGKLAFSLEFLEDALGGEFTVSALEKLMTERVARGCGQSLTVGEGDGLSAMQGLLPQLVALGTSPVIATGSGNDDGILSPGTETIQNDGTNSIGSADLKALYYSVNRAYRNSPKAAWLMNDKTFNLIDDLRDRISRPLHMIRFGPDGIPRLLGKPVYTSNSLPDVGISAVGPVIFGDLSRFIVRQCPTQSRIQIYRELPGFVERGLFAAEIFVRYGCTLLATDPNASPLNFIVMQS